MKLTFTHTKYAAYLGSASQAIVLNLPPLLFATFARDYGIGVGLLGALVSVTFVIQIVVDAICVRYADRIGWRNLVVASEIFCAAGLIGLAFLPDLFADPYIGLLAAVVLYSTGGGILEVIISPIVEALPSKEKSSAMSMLHSFYSWGQVATVLLSTLYFVVFGVQNWRWLAVAWSIEPIFNAILFSKTPINTFDGQSASAEEKTPFVKLITSKLFWLFFALMICSGASEQAMAQWTSYFAETGLHVSKTLGDLLGPCTFAALMGVSRTFYGKFGERIDLKKYLAVSGVLCLASYFVAVFSPFPVVSVIGCAVSGLAVGIMWPGVLSLAAQRCHFGGTALFALLALAGDIGCSSGPSVVGFVSGADGSALGLSGLKLGLFAAMLFPLLLVVAVSALKKAK